MTHVLRMAALEIGNPMPLVVDVKAHYAPRDAARRAQVAGESYTLGAHRSR